MLRRMMLVQILALGLVLAQSSINLGLVVCGPVVWGQATTAAQNSGNTQQSLPLSRSIVKVDAGTVVGQENATRWNRTILLAKPRIASGDVSALSEGIRQAASTFVLTILATVDQDPQSAQPKFRLAEVGVGYSVAVGDKLKVIHADEYEKHGVQLSFIPRQMLSENEKQIESIRTVVRGSSLLMFDVPALLLSQGKHQDYVMRHLIWIDAKTGKLATMIWLLQQDRAKQWAVVTNEAIRWLEPSTMEDRAIHVDGSEFTFTIPSKRAFAMEKMPPGRMIPWSQQASSLAARDVYQLDEIQALLIALNEANLASQRK